MDNLSQANTSSNILTLTDIPILQAKHEMPSIDCISLKLLQDFFENEIMPYEYIYLCNNGLRIKFNIGKEDFCHLIYGTINKSLGNHRLYKGILGYDNIKNSAVNMGNLPSQIKSYARYRLKAFIFLPILLRGPGIIYFNQKLVPKGSTGLKTTDIDADFLLYKQVGTIKAHLFLKNIYSKSGNENTSCISFFHDENDNYIRNQIGLKVNRVQINSIKDITNTKQVVVTTYDNNHSK